MRIQRNPRSPYIEAVRPMVKDDLQTLREPSARVRIAKLRDTHHIMARLIVSGLNNIEIANELGYSISRVAFLRNSPAMIELCARYRGEDHEEWRKDRDQYYQYVRQLGLKSARKMVEKLDADDENEVSEIPFRDLQKIFDSSADRVGYHRKSTKENINLNFAAQLEAAIERSRKVTVIDVEPAE